MAASMPTRWSRGHLTVQLGMPLNRGQGVRSSWDASATNCRIRARRPPARRRFSIRPSMEFQTLGERSPRRRPGEPGIRCVEIAFGDGGSSVLDLAQRAEARVTAYEPMSAQRGDERADHPEVSSSRATVLFIERRGTRRRRLPVVADSPAMNRRFMSPSVEVTGRWCEFDCPQGNPWHVGVKGLTGRDWPQWTQVPSGLHQGQGVYPVGGRQRALSRSSSAWLATGAATGQARRVDPAEAGAW